MRLRDIKEWFRIKTLKPTGFVLNEWEHRGWGNSVYFTDWEQRRIVGWLSRIPREGDEYRAKLKSGKIGRFLITTVERCRDPHDMFFATVKDIGYSEHI